MLKIILFFYYISAVAHEDDQVFGSKRCRVSVSLSLRPESVIGFDTEPQMSPDGWANSVWVRCDGEMAALYDCVCMNGTNRLAYMVV